MNTERIYVQLLDGSTAWAPVNARRIDNHKFEILEDKEYTDYIDPLYLHEFYPGDIVELGPQTFENGTTEQVAKKIIKVGQWIDRKYKVFKFKATVGQITIDKETADLYQNEIDRIKKEHLNGQFFYPSLLMTVNKLDLIRIK
jgi:hypothetical protein